MARLLHEKGYDDVRPLLGGFDAWVASGYPVEAASPVTVPLAAVTAPETPLS
jgi:3-mercaptopyruvate sulfurtransferase SseA